MDSTTVIYVITVFIFIYIIFYYYRQYKKGKVTEKIIRAECPDYWSVEGPNRCRNTKKLGKCLTQGTEGGLMDFDNDYFNNINTGNYAKCRWAKKCRVAWDGIDQICV
jgi:hypothetical protein